MSLGPKYHVSESGTLRNLQTLFKPKCQDDAGPNKKIEERVLLLQ